MPKAEVAVIGAGYWGQNLVRNMAQLDRLGAICDSSEEVRTRMKALYPGVLVTESLDEILDAPHIGGVMVITQSSSHHPIAKKALLAGKHTYVEKPLSLALADAEELQSLAEERKLRLMVGHLLLYHPCITWLKEAINRDDFGRILYINCVRVNLGKVRTDENAMWSLAPHDISVVLHLLGRTPTHVAAHGFSFLHTEDKIEDLVFLTLYFADGQAAQIHVSWLDPKKKRAITVVGSKKMVTFDDMVATEKIRVFDKGVDRLEQVQNVPPYASYGDLLTLRNGDILSPQIPMREPLRALCEHFLHAMDTGSRPLTDGLNGIQVLKVLQSAQRSLEAKGAPISLSNGQA